ncbi:hypothetical protein UA08_03991 [Talaromyces atroroseus]|uniref:Sphingoid long-chain base transporter RSB1 n=1 Tax=Talaromyces atroroseus TaxID=1441469 RepID=A0A1Q5Q8H0_TALAT|nr:hypothetical protein UA08_03991 [Talaromyces atroroseus]OKL60427.1 hypothetical protein UA08_03991 [Talaromyces atroroseus]
MEWNSTSFNETLFNDPELCTLDTCPLSLAYVRYIPSLWGNAFFLSLFALILAIQFGLGLYYKTWTYMIAMCCGLTGEVLGYAGRMQMHYNPFPEEPFLLYLVSLTIAPAFLAAAVYLCLSRIVIVYGKKISYFRPKTYTYLFIAGDVIALLLQAAGGGITSSSSGSMGQDGINIMLAGVSWQVFSLGVFIGLCIDFALRVRRASPSDFNPQYDSLRASLQFKSFLVCLFMATLTIFVRSVFRCAELSGGFQGALANDQVTFMILEGAMISIAALALTVSHPGLVWKGEWRKLALSMKGEEENLLGHERNKSISGSDSSFVEMNFRSSERDFA